MRAPDPPAAPVRAGGPALGRRGGGGGHCGGCGALRVGSAPIGLFVQGELGVPIGHRGCWPGFGVVGGAVNCTRRVLAGGGGCMGGLLAVVLLAVVWCWGAVSNTKRVLAGGYRP